MRGLLFKGFVVVALIAAVVVPSASAKSEASVKLSILPLPASSLGSAAKGLPLESDSGVVNNADGFATGLPTTPNRWYVQAPMPQKTGRISGYALDYGQGTSGGSGVTEVRTSVDQYKTSSQAISALGLWGKWETNQLLSSSFQGGLTATAKRQKGAGLAVGEWYFAVLASYHAANIAPLYGFDEQFTEGRYVADVTVWAGSAAKAKKLVPALAKKLDARITQALAGGLHAKPVKLPPTTVAGPTSGGPDLSSLALTTSDLSGGQANAVVQNYVSDPFALSFYQVAMSPAGQFDVLNQGIAWFQTPNEANFNADVVADHFGPGQSAIDLSGVGDGARGALGNGSASIVFASGKLEEFLYVSSAAGIQQSQVLSLAQTLANRINAAGLGS